MENNDEKQLENCFDAIRKYKENEKNKASKTKLSKKSVKKKNSDDDRVIVRTLNVVRDLKPENRRRANDMLGILEKGHNRGRGR